MRDSHRTLPARCEICDNAPLCMSRMARVVVEGVPHHITQRGNNHQEVFLCDEDRRFYLKTLSQRCGQHGVRLLGYCLMSNHVHLIAVP